MNNMKHKILMTLALLLTAVTGAWADETPIVTITATGSGPAYSVEGIVTLETGGAGYGAGYGWVSGSPNNLTVTAADGVTITKVKFIGNQGSSWEDTESPFQVLLQNYYVKNASGTNIGSDDGVTSIEVYGTYEPPITVEWNASIKTGSFVMPAFDVEIDPIYAPAAQWAKVENVDQLPTAIEGIFAGTTDAIVKAGTVAMMGDGQTPQGIVMYAVTSINQATAPELSAFSATVPTAENIADEGADVLVWYYIQGANTPDGQEATAENTFNDSEIASIKVTVLPNKYDITFKAANDNTIKAGKATVTVGGTAATVTEGKLEGVKMGSEVKMTAKDGYKFRKVAAKKTPKQ